MFGKYQAVFRSRWRALLWAGGVCLTAYCTVPHEGKDPAEAQAIAALATAAGVGTGGAPPGEDAPKKHVNPWARQP